MLINCTNYKDGKKLADIPVDGISEHLSDFDSFVWGALRDAEPAELDQMKEEFNLHVLTEEDTRHGQHRPKSEEYGDSLFAVT